ncbi:YHS domain-containing protein [Candidatus Latescibacterota bacterium]
MCKSSISFLIIFIMAIFLILSGCSSASHEAYKHGDMQMGVQGSEQTNCPVFGGEIDKKFYVDHMGKRIYFCCKMCIAKFNEEPEKYMKKL